MPNAICIFCTLGVYLVTGGDWEKRGVICVGYGVWGARVPSEQFRGVGVGRVAPRYLTYPVGKDTI